MEAMRDGDALLPGSKELEIMGWDELTPELIQAIVMDDLFGNIFYFILFLIIAFGVLNTVQMSVFERTREIGIMMAIGTEPGQIVSHGPLRIGIHIIAWESPWGSCSAPPSATILP